MMYLRNEDLKNANEDLRNFILKPKLKVFQQSIELDITSFTALREFIPNSGLI